MSVYSPVVGQIISDFQLKCQSLVLFHLQLYIPDCELNSALLLQPTSILAPCKAELQNRSMEPYRRAVDCPISFLHILQWTGTNCSDNQLVAFPELENCLEALIWYVLLPVSLLQADYNWAYIPDAYIHGCNNHDHTGKCEWLVVTPLAICFIDSWVESVHHILV